MNLLKEIDIADLEQHPVTVYRYSDLGTLFGKTGVCEGCLCTWWKLTRSQFLKQKDEDNRKALRNIAVSRDVPGIWAYYKDAPVEMVRNSSWRTLSCIGAVAGAGTCDDQLARAPTQSQKYKHST